MKSIVLGIVSLAAAPLLAGLYGDTPDAKHAWAVHDRNRPNPTKVEPGKCFACAPSDAVVLFDGTKESFEKNWCDNKGNPSKWTMGTEGDFFCVPGNKNGGDVYTRAKFGDCQLHLEFRHDADITGGDQMRGNSGVFLMGEYEIQVMESYGTNPDQMTNPNYADGQAAAVYAENPPMVNPARKAGEWQTYDIVFHQPIFNGQELVHPGSVTVFFNGVLVQDHWEMEGRSTHCRRRPLGPHGKAGQLHFQDHGCAVHFRNIWYRPLPSRWDNKTHSAMSADEAEVMKLRKETAEKLFAKINLAKKDDAGTLNALLEVISYSKDEKFMNALKDCCAAYTAKLAALKGADAESKKGEVNGVWGSLGVLRRNNVIPADCKLFGFIEQYRKEHGWK